MSDDLTSPMLFDFEKLGSSSLSRSQSYALRSKQVDQTFIIDVALPAAPILAGQTLPVVYVLDGNGMFAMAAQIGRLMQSGAAPLPPVLIVGVGYRYTGGEGNNWQYFGFRHRDYSPTNDPRVMALFRASPPPYDFPKDYALGGAAAFLDFLNEELKPFIAANYPVDPEDQTLLGFSLGGLFVLDTLFTAPTAFNRYIAGSPGLSWDDRVVFTREAALAAASGDLPVDLFLSVGELEEDESDGVAVARVSTLAAMAATLRGRDYPSLRMTHYVFPGERHLSVIPATISRGLRTVFARAAGST